MRPTKLFISYAHEDHDAARRLFKGLTEAGLEPWFDEESLLPGQKWRPAIQAAIREARYFVALLSSNSISKKGFVQKEISEALDVLDEYPESDIYLIPVRLDECTPSHSRLKDINWVDMFPDWARGFQKLLLAVGGTRDPETKIKTSLLIVLGDGYTGPIELTVYSHHKPETLVSPTMDDPFELPAAMRTKDKRRIYWVRGGRFLEDSKTYGEEGIREGDMLILTDKADAAILALLAETIPKRK